MVAATGPSLTPEVAARVRRARWPEQICRVIAVNDAFKRLPYADILYACDPQWWRVHIEAVQAMFHGERWTSHEDGESSGNDKSGLPVEWNLNFIGGKDSEGFSRDPGRIHYGGNTGFQGINLALLKGATRVILVGFDMGGRGHFFGDHPAPLHNRDSYANYHHAFRVAAQHCRVPIVNATPGSRLDAFPRVTLDEALADTTGRPDGLLHRDGAVGHVAAG